MQAQQRIVIGDFVGQIGLVDIVRIGRGLSGKGRQGDAGNEGGSGQGENAVLDHFECSFRLNTTEMGPQISAPSHKKQKSCS
ncbi:hypothetical protein D3C87_1742800 [compost metagenome]